MNYSLQLRHVFSNFGSGKDGKAVKKENITQKPSDSGLVQLFV